MAEHIGVNGEEAEIHLRDYLRVLAKHKLLFIIIFIAVVACAAVYTLMLDSVYEAMLKLEVVTYSQDELPRPFSSNGYTQDILTSCEKLKSKELYRETAQNLGLSSEILNPPDHIDIQQLNASYTWDGQGPASEEYTLAFSSTAYTVRDSQGTDLGSARSGDPFHSGPLHLTLRFSGAGPDEMRIKVEDINLTVKKLKDAVSVNRVADTHIITLTVQADSQQKAASIANEIFALYTAKDISHKKRRLTRALSFAGEKKEYYRKELDKAREKEKKLMHEETIYSSVDNQSSIIANRLYNIEHRLEDTLISLSEAEKALAFATDKRDFFKNKLSKARDTQVAIKRKENIYSIGQQSSLIAQELSRVQSEKAHAQISIEKIKKGFLPDSYGFIDMVHGNSDLAEEYTSVIKYADAKIQEYEQKLAALPQVHREIVECTSNISFYSSMHSRFERECVSLEKNRDQLKNSHEELLKKAEQYRKKIDKYPDLKKTVREVAHSIAFNNRMFTMFAEKYEELKGRADSTLENIVMIEAPLKIADPVKPNRKVNAALGLILGLIMAGGSVFLIEYFDNTFSTVEEVEEETGQKILSIIPYINRKKLKQGGNGLGFIDPHTRAAESFKMLNTAVEFPKSGNDLSSSRRGVGPSGPEAASQRGNVSGSNGHAGSVVISSSSSGEGKSTVAANLAITAANFGVKTILVDADIKKSIQHVMFHVTRKPGFTGLLEESASIEEAVQESGIDNLHIIPAGHAVKNREHVITGEGISCLLKELENRYDLIVIDSPPVLHIDDSIRIAKFTRGMIYVVSLGAVDRLEVKRGVERIKTHSLNLLGVCVNDSTKNEKYYISNNAYYETLRQTSDSNPQLKAVSQPGKWRILK